RTSTIVASATTVFARIIPRRFFTATRPGKDHPLGVWLYVYCDNAADRGRGYFARRSRTLPPFGKKSRIGR
ncbi:MAG: hypothetical protein M3N09_05320, partial [Actinomycetota bacterium]|nr:hypothetical protein [Actinomycetota bacterium]